MAELRQNTWSLDEWYDQNVAGTSGGYKFGGYQYAQGGSNMGYLLNAPGPSSRRSSPVLVNGSSGEWQFVKYQRGIKRDGSLWAWGNNNNGELGQGQSKNQLDSVSSPIQIGTNTTWKYITGFINNYAIKGDNTLWTWGRGTHGSLGLNQGGSIVRISSPTQIPGSWATISTGNEGGQQTTLGTKTDGTLWSWGYGGNGGLGHNNRTQRSSPTQVGTDTSWSTNTSDPAARQTVDNGVGCQFAIKADGTLWSWGFNSKGQLGRNQAPGNTNKSSPTQIPGTWRSIHAQNSGSGIRSVFSTKTDGTLYSWGSNTYGGLGQNNRTTYSSPAQIPGTTWTSATYGITDKGHFMNIKTDGTYWTWGQNYFGTLGLNQSGYPNQKSRSSPTQVGTDTTWFATGGHSELIWALRNDSGT